jgi:hypothetical protein
MMEIRGKRKRPAGDGLYGGKANLLKFNEKDAAPSPTGARLVGGGLIAQKVGLNFR